MLVLTHSFHYIRDVPDSYGDRQPGVEIVSLRTARLESICSAEGNIELQAVGLLNHVLELHPLQPLVVVLAGEDLVIWNYTTETLTCVGRFEYHAGEYYPHVAVHFGPDRDDSSKWLAVGKRHTGELCVYGRKEGSLDYVEHKEVSFVAHPEGALCAIDVHQSLPYALTAGWDDRRRQVAIKFWDWQRGWSHLRTFHTDLVGPLWGRAEVFFNQFYTAGSDGCICFGLMKGEHKK